MNGSTYLLLYLMLSIRSRKAHTNMGFPAVAEESKAEDTYNACNGNGAYCYAQR